MDRITTNLLAEFCEEYGFCALDESEQFEHFVNFAIVSRECSESFDPEDVHVGGDITQGIDGLAIIVNGALVNEEDEVDDLLETNKYRGILYSLRPRRVPALTAQNWVRLKKPDVTSFASDPVSSAANRYRERPHSPTTC